MANIVLVGFMGVGKTSVAAELSRQLGWTVVDTDDIIEADAGLTIPEIFEKFGEPHFRDLESQAVAAVAQKSQQIISTGGGAVLRRSNVDLLKENGTVFCLTATPEEIWQRVGHETHRPLLQTPDPQGRIRQLLAERAPYYAQADHTIDTVGKSPQDIAEGILQILDARTPGKVGAEY